MQVDRAVSRQPLERLTNRNTTKAELGRQSRLCQAFAGAVLSSQYVA